MSGEQAQMDRGYWDATAADYDEQIHDSFTQDRGGIIRKRLRKHSQPGTVAADFGCGVGKYLPTLARRFKKVHAFDLAPLLIERAIAACGRFDNVTYHVADLADAELSVPACDFAVCTNVLIVPDRDVRRRILATMRRGLKPGAALLAVIPSTESALFVNQTLVEWNRREGLELEDAYAEALASVGGDTRWVLDGMIRIDGVATKHYLREEAQVMFADAGFTVRSIDKVEYDWTTELADPPAWLGDPLPWDWLFVVERR